jgi:hypothetical protein
MDQTVPASIRFNRALNIGEPRAEHELLLELIPKYFEPEAFSAVVGGRRGL